MVCDTPDCEATVTQDLEPQAPATQDDAPAPSSVLAQGVRYLLVGGSSAALELGIFWVLANPAHLDVRAANVIAVVIATAFNFAMNRMWAFKSTSNVMRSAVLYLIIWVLNLIFTTTVIVIAKNNYIDPTVAKFFTMAAVTLWNFQLWRKVVFV